MILSLEAPNYCL